MVEPKPIRIQLIENIAINKAGLYCLLDNQPDFKVLQHLHCQSDCRQICTSHKPDVLLMVMGIGTQCGIGCIQQILKRHPDTKIISLCIVEDTHIATNMIELGVKGLLCSHTPPEIMFRAIREVAAGKSYIDTDIARSIASLNNKSESTPFAILSLREYEIVRLMLNGMNQAEIGEHLFISPHTVANHHSHILKKLKVDNHIELTKMAIRHNLITF